MQYLFGRKKIFEVEVGEETERGRFTVLSYNQQIADEVTRKIEWFSRLKEIPEKGFQEISELIKITIPSSITSIGDYAFSSCENLTEITIPSSVTKIGSSAFFNCRKLEKIIIPSSITDIGEGAFVLCKLQEITIPSSITSIKYNTFSGCRLTKITIPSSVNSIDDMAFAINFDLEEITIPSSVTYIGNKVFDNCPKLKKIKISESLLNTIGKNNIRKKLGLNSNVKILDLDGRELVSLETEVPPQEPQDKGCIIC